MKPFKSDPKPTAKQSTYNRVPGRDAHTAAQKQIVTAREGAKSRDGKRAK